jgi:hypothetical protein
MAERWSGGIAAGYSDSEFARRAPGGARRSCRLRLGRAAQGFSSQNPAPPRFAPSGFFDAGLGWATVTRYRSATVAGSHGLPRPQRSPARSAREWAVEIKKNNVSEAEKQLLSINVSTNTNMLIRKFMDLRANSTFHRPRLRRATCTHQRHGDHQPSTRRPEPLTSRQRPSVASHS